MRTLQHCPACLTPHPIATSIPTNVTAEDAVRFARGLVSDSQYAVCSRCDLLFARRRQDESDIDAYYRAFEVIEQREYAVYPPPDFFLRQQQQFSDWLLDALDGAGALNGSNSVLNVRSECGTHLANLRDRYGVENTFGMDHFKSNLRFAREDLKLDHVDYLHPMKFELPFRQRRFDLVMSNHQVTHSLDPLQLLRQLRDCLTPDGLLVLYNENDHRRALRKKRTFHEGAGNYHKQLLTRRSLHNLCRLAGLRWERFIYRGKAIKWACPRDTMLVVARRDQPMPVDALPRTIGSPIRRRIAIGRSVHSFYKVGKRIEQVYRQATTEAA